MRLLITIRETLSYSDLYFTYIDKDYPHKDNDFEKLYDEQR